MKKSHRCHEDDPNVWEGIQFACLQLLTQSELDQYRRLMPDDEDRQVKWEPVINDDTKKYVSLLVGQMDDEEQRAEKDKENYHDTSEWEQTTKNYFLSYHEVQAHLCWIASRPAEAEAYKRFQVGDFIHLLSLCHEPIAHRFNNVIDLVQSTGG
jgi:hypothetical protein